MTDILSPNRVKNAQNNRTNVFSRTKERWLDEGIKFYNAKRFDESLSACEQALHLDPRCAQAYYGKGLTLSKLNHFEEALAAFEQAIRLKPDYARAYNGKGSALSRCGLYEESILAFERAINAEPKNGNAYFGKAEAFFRLKRYNEALDAYDMALRLDFRVANMDRGRCREMLQVGNNHFQSHNFDDAYVVYLIASLFISNQPEDYRVHAQVLYDKGKRLFEFKHYQEALQALEIAILLLRKLSQATNTGYIELGETLIGKGEVLFRLKRFHEIFKVYKEVRAAYNHDSSLYNAKSLSLIQKARDLYRDGFYLKSYAAYKRAILFNPKEDYKAEYNFKSQRLLYTSLDFYENGQYEMAFKTYEAAMQFNPDSLNRASLQVRNIGEARQSWYSRKHQLNNSQTRNDGDERHKDEKAIDYEGLMGGEQEGFVKKSPIFREEDTDAPDYYYKLYQEFDIDFE